MPRLDNERPPIVGVGALVIREDGAALIGHRVKHGEPESWCLPGGHVEAGESFEDAAVREIAEETGILGVENPHLFAVLLARGESRTAVTAGVVARVGAENANAATTEPHVFDEWLWALPGQFPAPLFPATAGVVNVWLGRPAGPAWIAYPVPGTAVSRGVRS